jgi:beta-phosphoglucomutase-like phosphatase (HAD superfamily)
MVAVAVAGRSFGPFDAFVFNMDGVVTDTARLHAAGWRVTFDRYLPKLSVAGGVGYVPFDTERDYLQFMDGRLRYDGAACFLAARGITLPYGAITDPPGPATICGLANDAHAAYAATLEARGVDVYPATVALIRRLRPFGVQMELLGLPGKPDPSAFLEAARRVGVSPGSGVAVEDAVVGVQAARAAGFGLVVGLAHARPAAFRAQLAESADIVLGELDDLAVTETKPRS